VPHEDPRGNRRRPAEARARDSHSQYPNAIAFPVPASER
jgi:hypothetical protein